MRKQIYKEPDGSSTCWLYEDGSSRLLMVINDYVEGEELVVAVKTNPGKPLKKTEQTYYNPKTGKYVGYVRAKVLNLV